MYKFIHPAQTLGQNQQVFSLFMLYVLVVEVVEVVVD